MNLIIAKNKVQREQLADLALPAATDTFKPLAHSRLVDLTLEAIERAGLTVLEQEHSIARDGLRYFGGFALKGELIDGSDRQVVLGLRNANDKSFPAAICIGNRMLVCENLCFSSDIKLARRHTVNIMADLPRLLADAVGRCVSHWNDMGKRIEAYKQIELDNARVADLLVSLVDARAFPARDIYNAVTEFRSPRYDEFKGGTLWTLYNSITENLKGGDLSKLPFRTMTTQSIFDRVAGHRPSIEAEIIQPDSSESGDEIEPLVVVEV